ncbi:hypothetical protein lpa_03027 [Legionella pneumophila 2300/99 Alcoy]|nr:hypothetical protein lpa_03027 [Legionella pneumophila 2300/99 Alcoy]
MSVALFSRVLLILLNDIHFLQQGQSALSYSLYINKTLTRHLNFLCLMQYLLITIGQFNAGVQKPS